MEIPPGEKAFLGKVATHCKQRTSQQLIGVTREVASANRSACLKIARARSSSAKYRFREVRILLSPVHTSNNVEATFDFVEMTKFQRRTLSTLLPFLATKSNVASTSLLVWTGLYVETV